MKISGLALAAIGLMTWSTALADAPVGFDGAKWIWSYGGNLNNMSAGSGYFRGEVSVPEVPALKSAEVIITCDNLFVLYLNGNPVGESATSNEAWRSPKRFDVTSLVVPGRSVVAVEGINTLRGPAALLVKFVAELADGQKIVLASDANWKCHQKAVPNWQQPDFNDQKWPNAQVVGQFGGAPWGTVSVGSTRLPSGRPIGQVHKVKLGGGRPASRGRRSSLAEEEPGEDFVWPEAVVFVGDDCSLYRDHPQKDGSYHSLSVTIFNPRRARTFPEHDLPAPMKVGHKLYMLKPAKPGVEPRLLVDAGRGGVGSPSATYDGKSILVSMAFEDEPFYHIYRVPAGGGKPVRLTEGPFHDIDPAELPDGRIVFTSTRIGRFEEYHNPPSRSLFTMNADGTGIRPITNTIIFDNEPEVLADGRILFIRSDNFFGRGKVETLLHAVHTDGSEGYTEFGLDNGPEYGGRLRAYLCGSPAPMPDGRLAFLSGPGITIGRPGYLQQSLRHFSLGAGDVAALPDGRLLCTTASRGSLYDKIRILDPEKEPATLTTIYQSPEGQLHSPVFLGPRQRPPQLAERIRRDKAVDVKATGLLFCSNARFTKQTTAGWQHIRAIRVIAAKGLTTRSSHSYIVHAGNETIELGTVPLAPDGSFSIEVPADTPVAFQAVDGEGRSELNEMSWIYVRPGERRGCVGCHHTRQATPLCQGPLPLAASVRPLRLLGQGDPHRFRGNNAAVTGLMENQFDRYREVAGINRHSEAADPVATGPKEVETFIAQLRGSDAGRKISASQRLSIFREPAAAAALAECLRDPSRETRVAAAFALGTCGTRQSVPPLLDALGDPDALVSQAAAIALENISGHDPHFNGFAAKKDRGEQADVWRKWFADNPWDKIEQNLAKQVQSEDRDVVRRAAVALGHTGSKASRAPLRDYVARQRQTNPFPAWRKRHRGDGARFNSLSEANQRTLQAATRSLGYLGDAEAVGMLAETIGQNSDPNGGNLFLAEAAAEALGRIGTPEAEEALVACFAGLQDYHLYTLWYGDHPALMSCHASPVHYFIIEALDRLGSTRAKDILPHIIRSVPIDPDRALLLVTDDYETLVGRVIRRHGAEPEVVETCLAILGDKQAMRSKEIEAAIGKVTRCWAGHPGSENRAAQILSMVCRDREFEPRVRAAFERYMAKPMDIPRVFDRGIPQVQKLPLKNWACFYLARTLGNMAAPQSADALIAALKDSPPEAATGYPDPLGPGVLFLHNDLTPCWRAAVAWALGRIKDQRAVPILLAVVGDMKNATDTRHAAAEALGRIADPTSLAPMQNLAKDYPEVSTRRALLKASEKSSNGHQVRTGS